MTCNNEFIGVDSSITVLKESLHRCTTLGPEGTPAAACTRFMDLGLPSPGVEIRMAEKGGS